MIPYFCSASMKAAPSGGSGVAALRYSSIDQAETPLTDSRFVSSVMGPPGWYGLARGMRASTEGAARPTTSTAASTASATRERRRGIIGSQREAESDVEPRCGVSVSAPDDTGWPSREARGEPDQRPPGGPIGQVARFTYRVSVDRPTWPLMVLVDRLPTPSSTAARSVSRDPGIVDATTQFGGTSWGGRCVSGRQGRPARRGDARGEIANGGVDVQQHPLREPRPERGVVGTRPARDGLTERRRLLTDDRADVWVVTGGIGLE